MTACNKRRNFSSCCCLIDCTYHDANEVMNTNEIVAYDAWNDELGADEPPGNIGFYGAYRQFINFK